jgi:organic radical activating enzyme
MEVRNEIGNLTLGITRKCNITCEHCLCGKAQDVNMSKAVMKKIFSETPYVKKLSLIGGEPMMAPEVLTDLIEVLEELESEGKPVHIESYLLYTNGTLYNEKFFCELERLKDKMAKQDECRLLVSFDDFHQAAAKKIMTPQEYLENIKRLNRNPLVSDFATDANKLIWNSGRAKSYCGSIPVIENIEREIGFIDFVTLDGVNTLLINALSFNTFGDIVDTSEYNEQEQNAMGNIMNNSVFEIIANHPKVVRCTSMAELNAVTKEINRKTQLTKFESQLTQLGITDRDALREQMLLNGKLSNGL